MQVLFYVIPSTLVITDKQMYKLFSTSTISHFHYSVFDKDNFIWHNLQIYIINATKLS